MDNSQSVNNALDVAASRGAITHDSKALVINGLNATTMPARIGGQLEIGTTYPSITKLIIDASGSMYEHEADVVAALNLLKKQLEDDATRTGAEYLLSITDFSGSRGIRLMRDFEPIETLKAFTANDYKANGSTPLFNAAYEATAQTIAFGATVFVEGATGYQQNIIILSDGANTDTGRTAADYAKLLREFTGKSNFIVAFIGFGDLSTNRDKDFFTQVAISMGIPAQNIRVFDPSDPNCLNQVVTHISSSVKVRSQKAAAGVTQSGDFFVTI